MSRNPKVKEECNPRKIVIAFDNEDKGTKGLPGYKALERDRYDTDAWKRASVRVFRYASAAGVTPLSNRPNSRSNGGA
jgi:hypothetical protein